MKFKKFKLIILITFILIFILFIQNTKAEQISAEIVLDEYKINQNNLQILVIVMKYNTSKYALKCHILDSEKIISEKNILHIKGKTISTKIQLNFTLKSIAAEYFLFCSGLGIEKKIQLQVKDNHYRAQNITDNLSFIGIIESSVSKKTVPKRSIKLHINNSSLNESIINNNKSLIINDSVIINTKHISQNKTTYVLQNKKTIDEPPIYLSKSSKITKLIPYLILICIILLIFSVTIFKKITF